MFRKSTYNRESAEATRLRGVGGIAVNGDLDIPETASNASEQNVSSKIGRSTRFHKVAKGETIYSIARKRGMTVDAICRLNHIRKNAHIRAGQILKYN